MTSVNDVRVVPVTLPCVWVGCMGCYNNGYLIGEWVSAEDADGVTLAQLHQQFERKPDHLDGCEELWCFDTELPTRCEMSPDDAAAWGQLYTQLESTEIEAFSAWVRHHSFTDSEEATVEQFRDQFCGEYPDFSEYAVELMESTGSMDRWPEQAQRYFNWDSWIDDVRHDYEEVSTGRGSQFIFRLT